jgi:hypothetical protein
MAGNIRVQSLEDTTRHLSKMVDQAIDYQKAISLERTEDEVLDRILQSIEDEFTKLSEVINETLTAHTHDDRYLTGVVSTMTGDEIFTQALGNVYLKDPGGAGRNLNPSGSFNDGIVVFVVNTADAAETLTFDSAGLNQAINQNERGIFAYNGTDWLKIYVGS